MFRQIDETLNSANSVRYTVTPQGALYLATLSGAKVLELEDQIGNLVPGKDADFVVVDHRTLDPLGDVGPYTSPEHILSRLCYNADTRCVKATYILGERKLPSR